MVIKTDTCFYTEFKIYPGHGIRAVRKDGKLLAFLNRKARSLNDQKIKAQKLTWSQQWRRRHKKGKVETVSKKRAKRSTRVPKSIQGLDLEALLKQRASTAQSRKATREAGLRAVKERKRKTKDEKKKASKFNKGESTFKKVPKSVKQIKAARARR